MKPHIALTLLLCSMAGGLPAAICRAQAAAPAQQAAGGERLLGTVVATDASSITLKLESGGEATVAVGPDTRLVRTAPGAKTLAGATVIHISDLAPGDRILVRATPGADATHVNASAVIAMKRADIAQAQQQSEQDWQHRGVSGVVKSLDISASPAVIVLGTAQPGHTLTLQVSPKTVIRRYSSDSVKFADAKMSTLDQLHPGDQVRARVDRTGDTVAAEEVVAGTFRNIAGTVASIDAAENTVTVTDLATKKPLVLKLTADTQAHKLAPETAQRIAARFRSDAGGTRAGAPQAPPSAVASPAAGRPPVADSGAAPQAPRGDLSNLLQRAPSLTLTDLKKGDVVMVVATQGSNSGGSASATAITLIAGVEPLLEASPSASQGLLSASWNLGGGGDAAAQ